MYENELLTANVWFNCSRVDWVNQRHLLGAGPFSTELISTLQGLSFQHVSRAAHTLPDQNSIVDLVIFSRYTDVNFVVQLLLIDSSGHVVPAIQ